MVRAQIGEMGFVSRAKKVSLGTIVAWMAEAFLEARIERNRIKRHLDIDWRRKLRPHSAHALAGGSFALRRLALDYQNIFAAGSDEVVSDAGADNSSADENDICSVHGASQL